jgi:quercetin dioxygenase-like cupin family protein
MNNYKSLGIFLLSTFMIMSPFSLQSAEVDLLFSQELMDMPGKTGQILTVDYAPGESSAQHRHNAHTFVYVLEGSVIMQVKGSDAVTLSAGQTFYENPDDIHSVSKNASDTEPATILVFFIKESKAPPTVPVK